MMLRVYIAPHCPASARTLKLVEQVRSRFPDLAVEVIDVSVPERTIPDEVIGTPVYTWNDRVLFLGNPGESTLLEYMRSLQ